MNYSIPRLCLVFLAALALCLPVKADYQEGYVVTLKGDTLFGQIDMDRPHSMMHHCRFKSTETGKVTRFKPNEIKSFATVDLSRRFISGTVPYFFKNRRIFLEVLQSGRLNLYFTYDAVLNNLFYVSKREGELVDLMYDWDKNHLIPLIADHVTFLKKIMVDAPELLPDIERMKTVTPGVLYDLVGKYNRRFNRATTLASIVPVTPTVAEPKKQMGLSVSPGMVIPNIEFIDQEYIDAYCGLSLTKRPTQKRNGFYFSAGFYKPAFSVTTQYDDIRTLPPIYHKDYEYMYLVPIRASYRFLKNQLQPMVGVDFQSYLNNVDNRYIIGPSFGLNYTPIKWVTLSCSFQYILSVYERVYTFDSFSPFNLFTEISINF